MNLRTVLLMLALGVTVWLSLTGPDEGPGEVAEAVVRPVSRSGAAGKTASRAGGDSLPTLKPRPAPYKSLDAALAAE